MSLFIIVATLVVGVISGITLASIWFRPTHTPAPTPQQEAKDQTDSGNIVKEKLEHVPEEGDDDDGDEEVIVINKTSEQNTDNKIGGSSGPSQNYPGMKVLVTLITNWVLNNKPALITWAAECLKKQGSTLKLLNVEADQVFHIENLTLQKYSRQSSCVRVDFEITVDSLKFASGPVRTRVSDIHVTGHVFVNMISSMEWPYFRKIHLTIGTCPEVRFQLSKKVKATIFGPKMIQSQVDKAVAAWAKDFNGITLYSQDTAGPSPSMQNDPIKCMVGGITNEHFNQNSVGEDIVDGLMCDGDTVDGYNSDEDTALNHNTTPNVHERNSQDVISDTITLPPYVAGNDTLVSVNSLESDSSVLPTSENSLETDGVDSFKNNSATMDLISSLANIFSSGESEDTDLCDGDDEESVVNA